MSKHKTTTEKPSVFTFEKLSSTNPPKFKRIEKLKDVIKKTKPLNKNSKILEFFFDQQIDNYNNNKKSSNNNNNNSMQDIFNPKNMEYSTSTKPSPQILISDSQTIVSDSAFSSHPSLYILSSSSPAIESSIVDSSASTQASNISKTFELIPTPSLSPILTEKTNNTLSNVISVTHQKNQ
jgi:hypothetical protein